MSSRSLLAASSGVHFKSPKYVWASPLYEGLSGEYFEASLTSEHLGLPKLNRIPVGARFTWLEDIYENWIAPCEDPVSEFYQHHAKELAIFEWRLLPVLTAPRFQVRTATIAFCGEGDCR
jgi:hypothetical protein